MPACRLLGLLALCATTVVQAQQLFDASPGQQLHLYPADAAILSGGSNRNDLDCRVEPLEPRLDFDLKYRAGYLVHLAAEAIAPSGTSLRVLFRVYPLDAPNADPVYFQQRLRFPSRNVEDTGTAQFRGLYFLGPGRYQVDWLMRNSQGHVCSAHWQMRAPTPGHTGRLAAAARTNWIASFRQDTFAEEPPVLRRGIGERLTHVWLLVNLAPLNRERFKLSDYELESIMAMLRSLHREPSVGLFSLTAFSAIDRQVVYSAKRHTRLDFGALGEAIDAMAPGLVDVQALADPDGEWRFLADMLQTAIEAEGERPDAVVFLGPKIGREGRIPDGMLDLAVSSVPLFQFLFDRNPQSYPWEGAIESALKPLGLIVRNIIRPQDFGNALEDLLHVLEGDALPEPSEPTSHASGTQ